MIKTSKNIKLEARTIIRANQTKVLLHALGYIVITYVLSMLYSELSGYSTYVQNYVDMIQSGREITIIEFPKVKPAAQFLSVLIFFMNIVIAGGYNGYCLMRARGMDAGIRDIMPQGRFMLKILGINIFSGILSAIGCMFFLIPGLVLAYRYRLAIYVMFDHPEYSAVQCMRESGNMMKGNKWRLFKLDLSFIGWIIADQFITVMFVPVLSIWIQPYRGISNAIFYNELTQGGNYGYNDIIL